MSGDRRVGFWIGVVVGWAGIVFGVWGALTHAHRTKPVQWSAWIVGMAVVHDAVIAPLTFAIGKAIARSAPKRIKGWIQGVVIVSVLIVVASIPAVGGLGRRTDEPSLLPRNYVVGLAMVLLAVWVVAAVLLVAMLRRRRAVQ